MAQKTVTVCDNHALKGWADDTPADTYILAGYQIDLCDKCARSFDLVDGVLFAQKYGRPNVQA